MVGGRVMGGCVICRQSQRAAIERAILRKQAKRQIALTFAVAAASVQRHAANCMALLLVAEAHRQAQETAAAFAAPAPVGEFRGTLERAEWAADMLTLAIEKGIAENMPGRRLVRLLRELRRWVMMSARLRGEYHAQKTRRGLEVRK